MYLTFFTVLNAFVPGTGRTDYISTLV